MIRGDKHHFAPSPVPAHPFTFPLPSLGLPFAPPIPWHTLAPAHSLAVTGHEPRFLYRRRAWPYLNLRVSLPRRVVQLASTPPGMKEAFIPVRRPSIASKDAQPSPEVVQVS